MKKLNFKFLNIKKNFKKLFQFQIDKEVIEATDEICNALIPLLTSLLIEPSTKKDQIKPLKSNKKVKKIDPDNFCLQSKITGGSKRNDYNDDAINDVLNGIQRTTISENKSNASHGGYSSEFFKLRVTIWR